MEDLKYLKKIPKDQEVLVVGGEQVIGEVLKRELYLVYQRPPKEEVSLVGQYLPLNQVDDP